MGFGLLRCMILVAIVLHRKLCDATPVLTLTPGIYKFKSGDNLVLSCSVNELVNLSSVTFYQNTIQTIWMYNVTSCSFFNLIPNDQRNYSIICDPSNTKFTMIKYDLNVSDDKAVWYCQMISDSGGSCPISNNLCTSSNSTLILQGNTSDPNGTSTKETVTSTSSPSTSMTSTTIKATTNSTSTTHTATGSTTTTSVSTSASKSPSAGSTVNATSTSKPTTPETIGSASSPTNSSSQGGTDTKVIVIAVVVPIGGLLLIVIILLCIRHHRTGKKGDDIPDGMAAQDRGNNVHGFKHDRTAKQFNAIPSTSDDFIIYPGPAAMSTARPNKERKYHDVGYQYKTPYTGYQTAYVPSTYPSAKSSTHKDTNHHNVGHPYSRPYTGTYGNQTAYSPKNKSYDYESPYQIAASRPAYDRTAYYPQTRYYEQIGQDMYQRGNGQYSYGQRSRPHQDHNGRQQQREYYYKPV